MVAQNTFTKVMLDSTHHSAVLIYYILELCKQQGHIIVGVNWLRGGVPLTSMVSF